jgi:ribosomal-protein-alanine N-acetyltransferase
MTDISPEIIVCPPPSRVLAFLTSVDDEFATPLSRRVNLESYSEKLAANAWHCFAVANGQDVGHVAFYVDREQRTAFISSMAVIGAFQRQGVGAFMLDHLVMHCRSLSVKSISLEVHSAATGASEFYQCLGFTKTSSSEATAQIPMSRIIT